MWDTVQTNRLHLSHDIPCPRCGHAVHTYLACSDTCACVLTVLPGNTDHAAGRPRTHRQAARRFM
jgi:hypothetical protein